MDHQAYRVDVARPRPQAGTRVNDEQWHRKVTRLPAHPARPAAHPQGRPGAAPPPPK